MSVLLTDEADRVVDTSADFNQTALHTHDGEYCDVCRPRYANRQPPIDLPKHFHTPTDVNDCVECHALLFIAQNGPPPIDLPFVPPSQGARIAELTRRVAQQEGDLNQACRRIAEQGQTIRMVRRDLIDLLSKAKAGVEITFYDIANIIPDEPSANVPEYRRAA